MMTLIAQELIGREDETRRLGALLRTTPLIVVTGLAGVGKSALAGHLVRDLTGDPSTIYDLSEPATVAAALDGAAGRAGVLLLDNCDHAPRAAVDLALRLRAASPDTRVLATAATPLHIPGEVVVPLEPLAVPETDELADVEAAPAVRLLLARAASAGRPLHLDDGSAPAVAALARRLDGLPLAIELAAKRLRSLAPEEMLAYLGEGHDLLTQDGPGAPVRHRGLDAAIARSEARLPAETRRFLERLEAAVDGPFTLETAHRVGTGGSRPATAEHLDRLVEAALLQAAQRDGRTWYRLWQVVRAYVRGSSRRFEGAAQHAFPRQSHQEHNRFVREGAYWVLTYAGRTTLVADSKGMRDLSLLLAHAGRETHCSALIGAGVHEGDLGAVLDDEARRSYRRRAGELRADLAEAREANDLARAERLRVELDAIVEHLSAAAGLVGRDRRHGVTAERARSAVTWRIRAAIRRIGDVHEELGRHLRLSVRTGYWCSYQPESPIRWHV